jgi:hypothetical protein
MNKSYSLNVFESLKDLGFDPVDYSHLKFGCDNTAKGFGYRLAEGFFKEHSSVLLANKCVVIPSPYNYIPNAATIMARYFVDRLNDLLVGASGNHVEYSIIHRKVSYINDYGFLPKEKRAALINNDDFFMNTEFLRDKLLIFVDDVKITGTHEDKLIDIMRVRNIKNDSFFVYFGEYIGKDPVIESKLNFAGIKDLETYIKYMLLHKTHIIIRPMKFLLGQNINDLIPALSKLPDNIISEIYHGCLNEGYYQLPNYQRSFDAIWIEYYTRTNTVVTA